MQQHLGNRRYWPRLGCARGPTSGEWGGPALKADVLEHRLENVLGGARRWGFCVARPYPVLVPPSSLPTNSELFGSSATTRSARSLWLSWIGTTALVRNSESGSRSCTRCTAR
jgi:hypothetical protein